MPGPTRLLSLGTARERIRSRCLTVGARPGHRTARVVGLEGEWHTRPAADPSGDVTLDDLRRWTPSADQLPGRSAVTWEPGGQLELSSAPAAGVQAAVDLLAADAEVAGRELGREGVELVATGVDPLRPPRRNLHAPRYDAMEAFFDDDGPEGRVMMTRTASLQVNLDGGGDDEEAERRWRRAHLLGPTLIAA